MNAFFALVVTDFQSLYTAMHATATGVVEFLAAIF